MSIWRFCINSKFNCLSLLIAEFCSLLWSVESTYWFIGMRSGPTFTSVATWTACIFIQYCLIFFCFFFTHFFPVTSELMHYCTFFFPVLRKFMHYNTFIFYSQLKFRQLMHYCLYIFFFPVISEIINTLLFIHLFSSNKLVNSRIVICSSLFLQ